MNMRLLPHENHRQLVFNTFYCLRLINHGQ